MTRSSGTHTHTQKYCRCPELRYAFASAVGKRFLTSRIGGNNKTAIIDHHRSVQWAEKEFAILLATVQDKSSVLNRYLQSGVVTIPAPLSTGDAGKAPAAAPSDADKEILETYVLFADHCNVLHPIPYTSRRELEARMMWGK